MLNDYTKYPFVIIKKVDGEWWYHGAALEDARIVEVKDQYQLDQLRKTVNNVPESL